MKIGRLLGLVFALFAFASVARPQGSASSSTLTFARPDKDWAIQIFAPGFTITTDKLQPDGRQYVMASNDKTGFIISAFLERVQGAATSEDCHRMGAQRADQARSQARSDVAVRDEGPFVVVEFTIPEYNGMKVNQRNLFACLAHEDVYVDFHFSKTAFQPADEGVFAAYLDSAQIVSHTTATTGDVTLSSLDYFRRGSRLYEQQNYKAAIVPYQKALDLEKVDPKLGQTFWRVLLDNLTTAYGITGDLKNAQAVIEYGLSKDARYPMFYYNLACVLAGENDLDGTIANLKRAFEYKQNMIVGENLPDPRKDDSFVPFMRDKRFLDFLNSVEPVQN